MQMTVACGNAVFACGIAKKGAANLRHRLGLLRALSVGAEIDLDQIPVLRETWNGARQDVIPDGSRNNYHFVRDSVDWPSEISLAAQMIMCDAQTSGGLLIALPRGKAKGLLGQLRADGNTEAWMIGEITPAQHPVIRVIQNPPA